MIPTTLAKLKDLLEKIIRIKTKNNINVQLIINYQMKNFRTIHNITLVEFRGLIIRNSKHFSLFNLAITVVNEN